MGILVYAMYLDIMILHVSFEDKSLELKESIQVAE